MPSSYRRSLLPTECFFRRNDPTAPRLTVRDSAPFYIEGWLVRVSSWHSPRPLSIRLRLGRISVDAQGWKPWSPIVGLASLYQQYSRVLYQSPLSHHFPCPSSSGILPPKGNYRFVCRHPSCNRLWLRAVVHPRPTTFPMPDGPTPGSIQDASAHHHSGWSPSP